MSIVGLAFILALTISIAGTALSVVGTNLKTKTTGVRFISAAIAGGVAFIVLFLLNWMVFFTGQPVFASGSQAGLIFGEALLAAMLFGLVNIVIFDRLSAAEAVAASMCVIVLLLAGPFYNTFFMGQGNVDKRLSKLNVTMVADNPVDPKAAYPNTDPNHMMMVCDQVSMSIADGVNNQGNIGTRYNMFPGERQVIDGHMYYLHPFNADGRRNTNKVKGLAPGYVKVDAENFGVATKPELVNKNDDGKTLGIKYWPKGWWGTNLERHIWTYQDASGNYPFQGKYVDGLSFEADDQGNPYWTASLNGPVVKWRDSLPETFITVDAQTGAITEYQIDGVKLGDPKEAARVAKLPKVPAWVDRVYSASTAQSMIDNWAYYGHVDGSGKHDAPYQARWDNKNNRFKVSNGGLNLVYTTDGPRWQAILTTVKRETVAQYVVLMDTKSPNMTVYPAPQSLKVEDNVVQAFDQAMSNPRHLDVTGLALYKINGQLTWVGCMVGDGRAGETEDNGDPTKESFNGLGVLTATNSVAANVLLGQDKKTVFDEYTTQILNGSDNSAPAAESQLTPVQGTIAAIEKPVTGGGQPGGPVIVSTTIVIRLEDDPHYYTKQFVANDTGYALITAKVSDRVTIKILKTDPNAKTYDIKEFLIQSRANK